MLTVSLVEDDDDFRLLLKRSLQSNKQFRLISSYATAEEALKRLPQEKPTVALVDIKLPTTDGIECVRVLRAIRPALATHFVMLTGLEDTDSIVNAFKAGAHGYLLKDHTSVKQLCAAMKEVVGGGSPMTPLVARKVTAYFEGHQRPVILLSVQEQKVLFHLSQGLMYKEIASELSISLDTVRKHLRSIYEKLGVHSRTDAAMHYGHDQQWSQSTHSPKL